MFISITKGVRLISEQYVEIIIGNNITSTKTDVLTKMLYN